QDRLAQVLERLADSAQGPAEAVAFLVERARVVGATDERQAVAALEEARERAPKDILVLAELCRLYERLEMWSSLADTLEFRAEATTDRQERLALLSECARLGEDRLAEP